MNYKVAVTAMILITAIAFTAGLMSAECADANCNEVVTPTPTPTETPEPTPEPTPTQTPEPTYSCGHYHLGNDVKYIHVGNAHLNTNQVIPIYSDYNPERCGHDN